MSKHEYKLERGKKWDLAMRKAELKQELKTLDWLKSMPAIMSDIEYFLGEAKRLEETKAKEEASSEDVDYSSMSVSELKEVLDTAEIEYSVDDLKADLLKLTEGL